MTHSSSYPPDVAGDATFDVAVRLAFECHGGGRPREAVAWYRRALTFRPGRADLHNNLAYALMSLNRPAEAFAHFETALSLRPDYGKAHAGLGALQYGYGRYVEAAAHFETSLAREPDQGNVRFNLGVALQLSGNPQAARRHLEAVLERMPDQHSAMSQYLLCLNYLSDIPPEELAAIHRRFGRLFPAPPPRHPASPDPERRLRIGYLSVEFREHFGGYFLAPLYSAADRDRFELFSYSALPHAAYDQRTRDFQARSDGWVSVIDMSDADLAARIRADRIDILVDLAGHSGLNRLPALAGHPAPVQISWLGYPNTTGLPAMDYRLVDAVTDPEGEADAFASETLVRLPGCFLAFEPSADAPEVGPLPAGTGSPFTFGSFNTIAKITPEVLALWSRILAAVPDARLLLKDRAFEQPAAEAHLRARCAAAGIAPERVTVLGWTATRRDHLACYQRVDLALDPFPYNGTITTFDALWMGVPVLTMPGDRHAARVGASLMRAAGLSEFVADGPDDYVARAAAAARDPRRLAEVRAGMRDRLAGSILCDTRRFVANLEGVYRDLWRRRCAAASASPAQASSV